MISLSQSVFAVPKDATLDLGSLNGAHLRPDRVCPWRRIGAARKVYIDLVRE